jgi:drug/metabolite transporter (DMT)-like permease
MPRQPGSPAYKLANWALLILCSVIWGFSYYFIKHSLIAFDPIQVTTIRAVSAGVILVPFVIVAFLKIPRSKYGFVLICAIVGNGLPMYIYPLAQTHISSALTGIINSLTPLCTYFIGILFFRMQNTALKLTGVLLGLAGVSGLIFFRPAAQLNADLFYLGVALIAPVLYGLNANLLKKYLMGMPAVPLTALMYFFLMVPAGIMFFYTEVPEQIQTHSSAKSSLIHALLLGVLGTAVAMSLFNILIKRADIMFAASISYLMPVVAVLLGVLDNETLAFYEITGLLLILAGVLMINLQYKPAIKQS